MARKAAGDEQKQAKEPRKRNTAPKTDGRKRNGRAPAWDVLEMDKKLEAVRGWAMQGATMEELADMIGVHVSTLYTWQDKRHKQYHVEFAEAVRAGRYHATGELIASAFKQSTGYTVPEAVPIKVKKWELFKDEFGQVVRDHLGKPIKVQNEYIETVIVNKAVPANHNITQFMLKNWLPDQFMDKQVVEQLGKEAPTFVDDLSGEADE